MQNDSLRGLKCAKRYYSYDFFNRRSWNYQTNEAGGGQNCILKLLFFLIRNLFPRGMPSEIRASTC